MERYRASSDGPVSESIDKNELLEGIGFGHPEARARALQALADAGLTRLDRAGIARAKEGAVRELLAGLFVRLCDRCSPQHRERGRAVVPVYRPGDCEGCGGSPIAAAVDRLAEALRQAGLSRLLVVGGTPNQYADLQERIAGRFELRLVSGTDRHNTQQAKGNIEWADLVLVWGPTPLKHKVSNLYTSAGASGAVVTVNRRGIEALCEAACVHLEGRRGS